MRLSELAGKKIISQKGEEYGYVTAVLLSKNLKRIRGFCYADGDENDCTLAYSAVERFGDALIVKGNGAQIEGGVKAPFGKACYLKGGLNLGQVNDFIAEGGRVCHFCVGGARLDASLLTACASHLVFGKTDKAWPMGSLVKEDVLLGEQTLVCKGTVLTPEIIELAKRNCKSVELMLKSV